MKIINKIIAVLAGMLFVGIIAGILALTIRGIPGNPTPAQVVDELRYETLPFELSPERGRYALILSIVENNSFAFTKEIAAMAVPDLGTVNGTYVSLFAPGVSILAIPLYLLGRAYNLAQVTTFSFSAFFALYNVLFIAVIVRKLTGNIYAGLTAGMTFLFGTSAWAYASTLYQHHVTTFLLLWAYYLLLYKNHVVITAFVGFLFGLSIFVEYPNAVLFVPFMLWLFWKHVSITQTEKTSSVAFSMAFFAVFVGFAIGIAPTLWYNMQAHGNPMQLTATLKSVRTLEVATQSAQLAPTVSYAPKTALGFFKYERLPRGLEVLLHSKDRGVLFFSPVILLGLLGFGFMRKKNAQATGALTGGLIMLFALYAMWGDPWGGWGFGPRYLIPAFGMFAIALGVAIAGYGRKFIFGLGYVLLLNYSVLINLVGVLTTIKIPPSVEQDALLLPTPTFLHNVNILYQGLSSSYIYRTYVNQYMTLTSFAAILYITIIGLVAIFYVMATRKKNEDIV